MTDALPALLASIVLVASLAAVYLVTKSKRVEASIDVLGQLVDTLTTGNVELRATLEQRERQHQADRATDKAACDDALAAEREARRVEHLKCQKDIAALEGKVDVLTTNIADVIATAVVAAVSIQTAVQGPGHATTESTTKSITTTKPVYEGEQ